MEISTSQQRSTENLILNLLKCISLLAYIASMIYKRMSYVITRQTDNLIYYSLQSVQFRILDKFGNSDPSDIKCCVNTLSSASTFGTDILGVRLKYLKFFLLNERNYLCLISQHVRIRVLSRVYIFAKEVSLGSF